MLENIYILKQIKYQLKASKIKHTTNQLMLLLIKLCLYTSDKVKNKSIYF